MSEWQSIKSEALSVTLEPCGRNLRLVIELTPEAVAKLFVEGRHLAPARALANKQRRRKDEEQKAEYERRKLRCYERGRALAEEIDRLVASALPRQSAVKMAASKFGFVVSDAKSDLRYFRSRSRRERDERIENLRRKGLAIREIAKAVGVGKSTVQAAINRRGLRGLEASRRPRKTKRKTRSEQGGRYARL